MKKIYTLSAFVFFSLAGFAQTVFWTEDFGAGCNRGQLVPAFSSVNGAWTQTSTGTNDPYADQWYVSATAAGTGGGNCSDNCLFGNTMNRSLHVGNVAVAAVNIGADTGSTYLTGVFCGLGVCSTTNKRVESPIVNCMGHSNIAISFTYYEGGELGGDEGTLWFSPDAGITWTQIDVLPKTTVGPCSAPSASWVEYSVNLPASANNNGNVKFAFNWTNDNDGQGADPSFAVDDIGLVDNVAAGITESTANSIEIFNANGTVQVKSAFAWTLVSVTDILGQPVNANRDGNSILLGEYATGVYLVRVNVNGEMMVKKVFVQ